MRSTAACALGLSAACATARVQPSEPQGDGPYVLVLGTAQDGGLPQIGCKEAPCERARREPTFERKVTSLLLVDPQSGRRWLIDASPDLREQVELARGHPASRLEVGPRPPLFDGVFLTHAHVGHYTGLIHLGREAYAAQGLPVFASQRMGDFLRESGPWSLMVESGGIALSTLAPGEALLLGPELSVEAVEVPHRDEFSDTLAFLIRGPRHTLLYLPDIDKWERWDRPLEQVLEDVDLALVDGTFFDGGEVPGRDLAAIPHPFVVETLERLEGEREELRSRVLFTHLNHTNPLADPSSEAAAAVRRAGMGVASDGQVIGL